MPKKNKNSRRAIRKLKVLLRDNPLGGRRDEIWNDWHDSEFYDEIWDATSEEDEDDAKSRSEELDALEIN